MPCRNTTPSAGDIVASCSATLTARLSGASDHVTKFRAQPNFFTARGTLIHNCTASPTAVAVFTLQETRIKNLEASPVARAEVTPHLGKLRKLAANFFSVSTVTASASLVQPLSAAFYATGSATFSEARSEAGLKNIFMQSAAIVSALFTNRVDLSATFAATASFSAAGVIDLTLGAVEMSASWSFPALYEPGCACEYVPTLRKLSAEMTASTTVEVDVETYPTVVLGLRVAMIARPRILTNGLSGDIYLKQEHAVTINKPPSAGTGQNTGNEGDNTTLAVQEASSDEIIHWRFYGHLEHPGGALTEIELPITPTQPNYRKAFRAYPDLRLGSTLINPDWIWRYVTQPYGLNEPCNCEVLHLCYFVVNSGLWRVGQEREVMLMTFDPFFGIPYPRYTEADHYRQVLAKNIAYDIPATQLQRDMFIEGAYPCGYERPPQFYEVGQLGFVLEDCGPSYWLINAECSSK